MALTTRNKVVNFMEEDDIGDQNFELLEWFISAVETHIKSRTNRAVFESGAVAAQGTITMAGIAVADETFVIDTQTFTWKALRALAGEVTIGVDAMAAVINLVAAITADLSTVTAIDASGDSVIVTAASPGTAGNSIVFTEASTNMVVDGTGTLGTTRTGAVNAITEYHNGDGRTGYFHTDEYPVTAITSIYDDNDYPHTYGTGYLVDSDDYVWWEHGLVELVTGTFNKGLKNIQIIYEGGYATVPADLERLATEWAVLAFKGRGRLGINSQSAPDGSQTFFDRFLTPDLLAILHSYEDRASALCI